MKNYYQIKALVVLVVAFVINAGFSVNALAYNTTDKLIYESEDESSESNTLKKEYSFTQRKAMIPSDSISNVIVQYDQLNVGLNINRTYFIPGAGFHKKDYENVSTFNYELINSCRKALQDDFVTIESSVQKIPFLPLRAGLSGRWAIRNGYKPICYQSHGNIRRAIRDIEANFSASNKKTMNIIGSSYGSVVAANTVIGLLERDNKIDSIGVVVLSASMIDPESELGLTLQALKEDGKIGLVHYHSTPFDNITACSGKSRKDARRGFRKVVFNGSPSIVNMKRHIHNIASRDPKRAHELMDVIVNNSAVVWVSEKVEEYLTVN